MRRPSTAVLVGAGVLVALILAGVASLYASSRPDGLQRVAEDQGFARTADEHPVADGPLAGYRVGDGGTGAAGVVGVVVVLVLATGGAYAVRGRSRSRR